MKYRMLLSFLLTWCALLFVACGGSSAPAGSQETRITLTDFRIGSTVTTFLSGTPYHFVVTNNGKTAHEFMIMPMGMNMQGMSMDEMHKQALAMIDMVNPGETKTIDYTFSHSQAGQPLELACHLPGHYEAGMKEMITVHL